MKASTPDIDELIRSLREVARAAAAEHAVPGVAIGLWAGGAGAAGVGATNVDHPLEVTPTTLFQIASISKIFTATTAVVLAERGRLSLTEPIRTYLPGLRLQDEECARVLTLEDLLSHRSGWPGEFDVDTGRGDDALSKLAPAWEAAPQWARTGTQYSYSNLGYGLAGHVIATVAGASFEEVVTREVIRPLGLARTAYFLEDLAFERWAAGHRLESGVVRHAAWWRPRARGPNGGVLSCAEDLVSFARFHLGDGSTSSGDRLLSPGSLLDMRRPRVVDTIDTSVGLGWMLQRWDRVEALTHYGGTYGYSTALVLFPSADMAAAILTNAGHGPPVVDRLIRSLVELAFGTTIADPASGSEPLEADEAAGVYEGQNGALRVEAESNGTLAVRVYRDADTAGSGSEPLRMIRLHPAEPDTLAVVGAALASRYATLVRDEAGGIAFLRVGRRLFRRIT